MTRNRRESRASNQLDKKLAAYTLAGAAALIAPGAAQAGVIYVPNVNTTVDQPGTFDFNLSGALSQDIVITAGTGIDSFSSNPTNQVSASVGVGAQVMTGPISPITSGVTALAFGDLIDPSAGAGWGSGGKMVAYDTVANTTSGEWSSTGSPSYLGFYFGAPGSPQAGWAQIATTATATSSSFEVLSYAYETTPNVAITAGQTADAGIPEPSTMALLALGGVGLIALRRRRAANG